MIGKTPAEKRIDEQAKRLCSDANTPDFFDCDCGGMYAVRQRRICPRCGKKICPACEQYHGRETNFCYTWPELRISDDGVLTTAAREGSVYA